MLNHKKATIKDVALAAGVSTQTISRALNNRLGVSAGTRQRILEIIAALHCSPRTFARRMRRENKGNELITDALNFTQTRV